VEGNIEMADDANESASSLRTKLSESHQVAVTALARAVIAEKNLRHVKVEDLTRFSIAELEAKAVELNAQHEQAGVDALKTMLASKGVTDVDAAVQQFLAGDAGTTQQPDPNLETAAAIARARELGAGSSGAGVPGNGELAALANNGPAQIALYFEQQEAAKKR
jgi:hypothetical protein